MDVSESVTSHPIDRTHGPYQGEQLWVHVLASDRVIQCGGGDQHTTDAVGVVTEGNEVDVVIVEHADPDHYGGVPTLRETYNVEVAAPVGDAADLDDLGIEVDHRLRDGELFHGVRPIHTPGHTAGNMAFLYKDVLVAGDTVIGSDFDRAGNHDWTGPLGMLQASSHEDPMAARNSVSTLLKYEFEYVLTTHGSNVLENAREAVMTLVSDLES